MNIWASADVDGTVKTFIPQLGQLWKSNVGQSSCMILIFERWSSSGTATTAFYAPPMAGEAGTTPGERFGTEGGITPAINAGRFGLVPCELQYTRHIANSQLSKGLAGATGLINIGYADGHVQSCLQSDLANMSTGHALGSSMWSPSDPTMPQ
jgi:prepilin-type processing-associated H-X9-DG protein